MTGRKHGHWSSIQADSQQVLSLCYTFFVVDSQDLYSHSRFSRQWTDHRTIQFEMLCPFLSTRIEKRDKFARCWIKRAYIRPFEAVATHASQCKIVRLCFSSVLARHDVIRFVLVERCRLREQAIFAAMLGPLYDELAQTGRHVGWQLWLLLQLLCYLRFEHDDNVLNVLQFIQFKLLQF